MSGGVKILLIVLGSFAALLVVIVSLFIFVIVPRAVANIRDDIGNPVAQHKLAASIADFDIPPGYKQSFGTNMFFMKMVTLVPVHPQHRRFAIVIEGLNIPTASDVDIEKSMDRSLGNGTMRQCKDRQSSENEIIKAKSREITLHVMRCADPGSNVQTASAIFPGKSKIVMVIATGDSTDFDLTAVRRLLASVR